MPLISQHGTQYLVKDAPLLTKFVVIEGQWEESVDSPIEETRNGNGALDNVSVMYGPTRVNAEWVVKAAQTVAVPGDIVAEASPGTRKWLVLTANEIQAGKGVRQRVTLLYQAAVSGVQPVIPAQT